MLNHSLCVKYMINDKVGEGCVTEKGSMTIVAQGVAFRSAVGHTTTTSVRISATLKRKKKEIT